MTVPHITITDAHWIAADKATGGYNYVEMCNKAIEIALAEKASEQYITAEEARKLGAGKAEYFHHWSNVWLLCHLDCSYDHNFKYRAIKQEYDEAAFLKRFEENIKADKARSLVPEPVEPHAELKAMYEQQVKDGC